MPRINFVSFTFLFAFGLGSFAGIGLALLAVALATPEPEPTTLAPQPVARANTPTVTATPAPTATPTPVPVVRILSTQQVRIGPDEVYGVLGTLSSGSEIDVLGRDGEALWLAIEFPPGSSAQGWVPSDRVGGMTRPQIGALSVVGATLIDTTPDFPGSSQAPPVVDGNDGFPVGTPASAPPAPARTPATTATASVDGSPVSGTPTPRPVSVGPTDLAIGGYTLEASGALTVTVVNLGPGDVPNGLLAVQITAAGFEPEFLRMSRVFRAGESTTLRTAAIRLTQATGVSIVVDAERRLTDIDRSNNSISLTLTP